MILYINGDSHTAAAEAVNPHAFAEDDQRWNYLGRLPHPDNINVSWGKRLSDRLKSTFVCDAESASSNQRILRTTRQWLTDHPNSFRDTLVIIQWSTWEREEWLIDGVYYQVNGSGIDMVPKSHQQQYKEFISNINYFEKCEQAHTDIWNFHQELTVLGIKHIFFNGNNSFRSIPIANQKDWGDSYINPYDQLSTYDQWLRYHGFDTVSPKSWHFGEEAHAAWSKYMLQYIIKHHFI